MTSRSGRWSGEAWRLPAATWLVSLTLMLVLGQCTAGSDQAGAATAERGLIAYREAGCGACHGQTALGGSGPALGGHRAEQVVRQVRAPFGAMPMFTIEKLDDDDLVAIVMFVEGLEQVDHSLRWGMGLDPRDAVGAHHSLALTALRNGDPAEAAHQIEHIKVLVSGEHLAAMRDIAGLIEKGETGEAETRLAAMSGGYEPDAASVDELNLWIAAQALAASDSDEAIRHLDATNDGAFGSLPAQAQAAIDAGSPEDGAALIVEALGEG